VKTRLGLNTKYSFKLVKWDGVPTPEQQELANPAQDPKCLEIREWTLGQPNAVTYKKDN
jgi:hypothetical protein